MSHAGRLTPFLERNDEMNQSVAITRSHNDTPRPKSFPVNGEIEQMLIELELEKHCPSGLFEVSAADTVLA